MPANHRNRRLVLAALLGIAALGLGTAADAAEYSAHLNASPARYDGGCPGVIAFKGTITATRAGRVQYKFIRSDGAFAPVQTLDFAAPGTKSVATTWTLGGAGLPSYNGWEAIQIVYPAPLQSKHADFSLHCRAPARARPDLVIRSFGLKRWGVCKVGRPVFVFQVTVANIGHAPSPAISGKAMVQVKDQHPVNWGGGATLGAIPPGGSQTVDVPVYYLQPDPAHMTAAAPHPFRAFVDPLHLVNESNEANNASQVINVDPRGVCKKAVLGLHRPLINIQKLR
jgi:hypothetical protein